MYYSSMLPRAREGSSGSPPALHLNLNKLRSLCLGPLYFSRREKTTKGNQASACGRVDSSLDFITLPAPPHYTPAHSHIRVAIQII